MPGDGVLHGPRVAGRVLLLVFSLVRLGGWPLMALTGSPQCCSVNLPGWLSLMLHV